MNLGKYEDISEFILKQGGYASDSEAEDLPDSQVTLSQNYGSRLKNTQIAIRLVVTFVEENYEINNKNRKSAQE